jgi:hypothetical protein
VRQQFFQALARVRVDARQHITQVGPRIQTVELGRLCLPPNYAERACLALDSP